MSLLSPDYKGGIFMAKKTDLVDSGTEIVKAEKKKMKPRGGNSPAIGENMLMTEPGDTTKIVQTNMKFLTLPKVDLRNPEAVRQRIWEYFQIYAEADMKPTVAGMAMALGVDRRRLWEIKTGAAVGGQGKQHLPEATLDYVKKAYDILEMSTESYANSGKTNPVMAIFMLKNHFGYQDKTEYVLTPNQQQVTDYDADEISKRYLTDSATIESES
jgi:hypothetical protein